MDPQKYITFFLIITMAAVAWLVYRELTRKKPVLPELEKGDRIAVLKPGESNLTIKRIGTEVIASDEEGAEIALKTTRE